MIRHVTAAGLMIVGVTVVGMAQRETKPRVPHPFVVEDRGAVGSLAVLVAASDLIVEGVVGDEAPADYGDWPDVYTMYEVQVVTVLKTSPKVTMPVPVGGSIALRRWGGERDRGNRIDAYVADNYPLFARGQRLILFLRARRWAPPAPYTGMYFTETTYGPDSVFEVTSNQLRALGKSQLSRDVGGRAAGSLRGSISRLAGGG
jgi:hypothetical protein